MLNISSTPLAGHKAEIAKRTFSALRGIYSDLRKPSGRQGANFKWAATFEQFKKHGGATGYRDMRHLERPGEGLAGRTEEDEHQTEARRLYVWSVNPVFAWFVRL